jgi:hypothetical protein
MAHLTQADWDEYGDIINEFHEDANQEDITWRRMSSNLNRWGEDGGETYTDTTILGLIQYNFFRSWAINKTSTTGELDKESVLVYFNTEYLRQSGWLTTGDQFDFRPGEDRFIINGQVYKALGDSQVAQAKEKTLMSFIILKREETKTGNKVYE